VAIFIRNKKAKIKKSIHRGKFFWIEEDELACFLIEKIRGELTATQNL
jgi:hypothetical protein